MQKAKAIVLLCSLLALSPIVQADDDGSYVNYEALVNQLKASAEEPVPLTAPKHHDDFDWDEIAIHGGVALATSYVGVTSPDGVRGAGLLKGLELTLGMNLFTRKLRAEGAFSQYSQGDLDSNLHADLKEFELRFVYMPPLTNSTTLRFGSGIAARYLDISARAVDNWINYQASTPASIFLLGLEHKITDTIALGPDISYRSALVADTFEKSAWDASFRLNATF